MMSVPDAISRARLISDGSCCNWFLYTRDRPALAMLLRARYLVDVDCWSEVRGQPIKPSSIREVLLKKLQ